MLTYAAIDPEERNAGRPGLAVLAAVICVTWILPGLIGHDPWKPDEAHTFGLVWSILQGGSWVVPSLAGEPFLDKPPLYPLTAALLARLFDPLFPLHDGARLASGLYLCLALAFVALAGRELYGRDRGWLAALLMMGSLGLIVRGHQMIADTALVAGFAMAAYGFALALRRPLAGGAWLGTGVGIGFMAKGLLAPAVLAAVAALLPIVGHAWRTRAWLATLAAAACACAPWLVVWPVLLHRSSPALFHAWLTGSPLGRLLAGSEQAATAPALQYAAMLPWYAWPALPLALWVLWGARIAGFARAPIQLPLLMFVIILAALCLFADGRDLHAMPMLVPLALLATPAVFSLRRGAANAFYWFGLMGFTFFAGVFWVYWSALELGVPARLSTHLHKLQPAYESGVRWLPLLLAAALCAAWIALITRLPRMPERPVVVWSAGMALVWGVLMTLFVAYFDAGKSYRSMVASLSTALPKRHACIASRSLGESQRAMLHYYAGIATHRAESPDRRRDCDLLLVQTPGTAQPVIEAGWQLVWDGARPGDDDERFWLYRRSASR